MKSLIKAIKQFYDKHSKPVLFIALILLFTLYFAPYGLIYRAIIISDLDVFSHFTLFIKAFTTPALNDSGFILTIITFVTFVLIAIFFILSFKKKILITPTPFLFVLWSILPINYCENVVGRNFPPAFQAYSIVYLLILFISITVLLIFSICYLFPDSALQTKPLHRIMHHKLTNAERIAELERQVAELSKDKTE